MIEIDLFFYMFIILYVVSMTITTVLYRFCYKEKRIRLRLIWMFELYILLVMKIAIFPIRFVVDEAIISETIHNFSVWKAMQLIPMQSIKGFLETGAYIQIVGNILLLLPLPIFFRFLFKNRNTKKILLSSFCFCLGIEVIQLCICLATHFTSRIFDVDDILLNGIGILAGWGVCHFMNKISLH